MKNRLARNLAAASLIVAIVHPARAQEPGTPLKYTNSWIGNTFGGGEKWVQNFAEGMTVLPDGTVILSSGWDESGREFGIYKNGDIVGKVADTHGWGAGGGRAATADAQYMYIACTQGNEGGGLKGEAYPAKGAYWVGIRRVTRGGKSAPFAGGRGRFADMLVVRGQRRRQGAGFDRVGAA